MIFDLGVSYRKLNLGYRAGIKVFLTLFAIYGVIVGIFAAANFTYSLKYHSLISVELALFSALIASFKGKLFHLPTDILEGNPDSSYTATFISQQNLAVANALTKPYYSHEYVDDAVLEQWRQKNHTVFVEIMNSNGVLCASFGILALDKSFMHQFKLGRLMDTELKANDILDIASSKKASELYISGVVVKDPGSMTGHSRAIAMIWSMLEYLKKLYGTKKKRTLYALAVNQESENILLRCNFTLYSPASQRKDKFDLYSLEMSSESLSKIYNRIGDLSSICKCNYYCN